MNLKMKMFILLEKNLVLLISKGKGGDLKKITLKEPDNSKIMLQTKVLRK